MSIITLTPAAAAQIKDSATHANCDGMFLRVTGRPGDAESVIYGMGFDHLRDDDIKMESEGVTIIMTPPQIQFLVGATLDYVKLSTGHGRFVFVNPNDHGCLQNLGACGHCDVSCRPAMNAPYSEKETSDSSGCRLMS
jgi:iron-sulfur cluster assembly protein